MYKVCNELANRSGGGWDDDMHRPIAPSEAEYEEMVRMVPTVGGQTAKGEVRLKTYTLQEPIHCLLDTQMSIQISEQGSSDDPDDGNLKDMDSDSVRSKSRGPGSSRAVDGQSSDASFPQSSYFGSKRNDSSEPSIKGKRYKERVRKKKAEQDRLADAGFEIARVIGAETKLKLCKAAEEDECMALFDAWGIKGCYHDFCSAWMGNNYRRKWFLKNERHVVIEWIERNIGLSMPDPNPTSIPAPNPMPMPPPFPLFSSLTQLPLIIPLSACSPKPSDSSM